MTVRITSDIGKCQRRIQRHIQRRPPISFKLACMVNKTSRGIRFYIVVILQCQTLVQMTKRRTAIEKRTLDPWAACSSWLHVILKEIGSARWISRWHFVTFNLCRNLTLILTLKSLRDFAYIRCAARVLPQLHLSQKWR